jgi:hypothetical protein
MSTTFQLTHLSESLYSAVSSAVSLPAVFLHHHTTMSPIYNVSHQHNGLKANLQSSEPTTADTDSYWYSYLGVMDQM